ncbi:MAG TPA: FHA domain-containing protein [Steroidobacteraceae bacterium]|nr:FHA domain-containing protein [Steroidobacteraceae bacterium]
MAPLDPTETKKHDLESTDKLPILTEIDVAQFAEDAVRLENTAVQPVLISQSLVPEFARPSPVDLPALAESVRTVEARISRQSAEYEALSRLYERARDAEAAAAERAEAVSEALARASSTLAVEQHRLQQMEQALAEKTSLAEAARTRLDEALRALERHQSEARTLRDALATREATIVQVLHSLGERDAQLSALQREHAQTVPVLEARLQMTAQLEEELKGEREHAEAVVAELEEARARIATFEAQRKRDVSELARARAEAASALRQAETYLEALRTRDWRRGFQQNLQREWDERAATASADRAALAAECERLKQTTAALSAKVIEQDALIARKQQELLDSQRARADLASRHAARESECAHLVDELKARDEALSEARAQNSGEAQRVSERLSEVEARCEEQRQRIEQLESDAVTHEEEMQVLLAHLNEARKPVQGFLAESKRLKDELAAKKDELAVKGLGLEQLTEENRELQATLERTRGALEEREFLIRRLERSESNNAHVLGRLQTSIEKLGNAPTPPAPAVEECRGELVRLESDAVPYLLTRRTRIGRAPGCELQIDSSSVSRYHALILKGPRDVIVEDLNSTNGVIVNGRKISRQLLNDGDLVTIGDVKFRLVLRRPGQIAQGSSTAAPAPSPA